MSREDLGPIEWRNATAPGVWHPIAAVFEMMEGAEYAAFVEDIRANGVREPIVLFEGQILDGRNRNMAAAEAGSYPIPVRQYIGDDPIRFVISHNLRRRHLTDQQRTVAAAKLTNLSRGRPSENPPTGGISTPEAAALLGAKERSVEKARAVIQHGTPALVAEMEAQTVSISAAEEVARLPEDEQAEIVAAGPQAVVRAAAKARFDRTPDRYDVEKRARAHARKPLEVSAEQPSPEQVDDDPGLLAVLLSLRTMWTELPDDPIAAANSLDGPAASTIRPFMGELVEWFTLFHARLEARRAV